MQLLTESDGQLIHVINENLEDLRSEKCGRVRQEVNATAIITFARDVTTITYTDDATNSLPIHRRYSSSSTFSTPASDNSKGEKRLFSEPPYMID